MADATNVRLLASFLVPPNELVKLINNEPIARNKMTFANSALVEWYELGTTKETSLSKRTSNARTTNPEANERPKSSARDTSGWAGSKS